MTVIGIAAGPEQIADGTDPTIIAEVTEDNALKVSGGFTDSSGTVQPPRVDAEGRLVLSSADVIRELLIEMRLLNEMFAEVHFVHDLDLRRADIDRDLGP